MRSGAARYTTQVPTIDDKISWKGAGGTNFCADEWKKSMAAVNRDPKVRLKYTIPGPMSIMASFHNEYYAKKERDLAADLADVI